MIKTCSVIEQGALIKELSYNDVENELDHSYNSNPTDNQNKKKIVKATSKYMSTKRIRNNKYKHRKSPLMTNVKETH